MNKWLVPNSTYLVCHHQNTKQLESVTSWANKTQQISSSSLTQQHPSPSCPRWEPPPRLHTLSHVLLGHLLLALLFVAHQSQPDLLSCPLSSPDPHWTKQPVLVYPEAQPKLDQPTLSQLSTASLSTTTTDWLHHQPNLPPSRHLTAGRPWALPCRWIHHQTPLLSPASLPIADIERCTSSSRQSTTIDCWN